MRDVIRKRLAAARQHDRPRRLLFHHPEVVEDLLRGHIDQPWVDQLDFTTLRREPELSLGDTLDDRASDVVWRIEWCGRDLYLLVLLEIQSRSERYMGLRLLGYLVRLYESLLRQRRIARGGRLPPVFPVVFYNGRQPWRAPLELGELIWAPGELPAYQPSLRYWVVEERLLRMDLGARRDLVSAIAALDRSRSVSELERVVHHLLSWLGSGERYSLLRRSFNGWLREILRPVWRSVSEEPPGDLKETGEMLEKTVQQWERRARVSGLREGLRRGMERGLRRGHKEGLADGLQQGLADGRRFGEVSLLERQLERRFGGLSAAVRERLYGASESELLLWGERLLDAASLAEVFESRDRDIG